MNLYMTELAVSDFAASVAWYRDVLGLLCELFDTPYPFALLGRLSLKQGVPQPDGVILHFESSDFDTEIARLKAAGVAVSEPKINSNEGHISVSLADPDGHRIILFTYLAG